MGQGGQRRRSRRVRALLVGALGSLSLSLAMAAPAAAAPDPFHGTWYDGLSPTPEAARAELDRQAAAGIGLVRQYVFWDRIERSPGSFDWSRTDQLVADASARGVQVLPTLLYTPEFYTSEPVGSTSSNQFPPADPQSMARFAEAMVDRYGPNGSFWCTSTPPLPPSCRTPYAPIRAWEVWNEPDFPSWWKGRPDATEYAPLLVAVSEAIHRADPGAEVVLGALTNGSPAAGGYLEQLYDLGAGPYFDTISINPYAHEVRGMVSFVRATRAVADRHGDADKPIRVTEYGWASGVGRLDRFTTEACQAALMHAGTQRLAALRTELDLTSIIQFQWRDLATTSTAWPHYAGLLRSDGSAKPSLGALSDAIGERPTPPGLSQAEACPEDRRHDVAVGGGAADDPFGRAVAGGWGSARVGGAYALEGPAGDFSVSGGAGRVRVTGTDQGRTAVLASTSARNVDARFEVATDRAAVGVGGQRFGLVARRVDEEGEYVVRTRFAPDGAVHLDVAKVVDGVEARLGGEVRISGLVHTPGQGIAVRARLTGVSSTRIEVKAWVAGRREPPGWPLTRTDSEPALQAAGAVGLRADLLPGALNAPVTFSVDTLHVTSPK